MRLSIPFNSSRINALFIYNRGHNILRTFDTSPNFFSPQVKRRMIIGNKYSIYDLPHELLNGLRLRSLGY